jgi:hypothetical protein
VIAQADRFSQIFQDQVYVGESVLLQFVEGTREQVLAHRKLIQCAQKCVPAIFGGILEKYLPSQPLVQVQVLLANAQ